ncbi:hypothetical protein QQX98_000862 [Neonectria punicea]|uniref:Xylanolytic transcriptional activator regulatory domain-containing protein n=1 Tax=Neonectria punicea TaxID=979145 RepID=A0ABR1HR55_9HYPO
MPPAKGKARNINCEYTTETDNRGTAPISYVHLLQARINLLEQVLRLHSIDIDESVAQLTALNASPLASTSLASDASSPAFEQLCTDFEGALCFDESSNFDHEGEARFFGTTSGRLEFESPEAIETKDPPSLAPSLQHLKAYPQALQIENNISDDLMSHLIDLYFKWEQPWLQVVDEELFRHSRQENGRYYSPLLLNCILAIGSRYCDRPEVRSDRDDPHTAGQPFLDTAEVLLHFDLKWPSITTIQSLAILAVLYVAIGSDAAGWLHHGMAIRLALDMGLNLDSSVLAGSSRIAPQEVHIRRQIYWALYCTDKLWASYTGRVCTMLDSQGMVSLPPIPDSDTDTHPQLTTSSPNNTLVMHLHRALSTHCLILENILRSLYPLKRLPQPAQMESLFSSYLLRLKNWYYQLPPGLKVNQSGSKSTFPHAYTLKMVYHTSIILLARPFLNRSRRQAQADATHDALAKKATILCSEAAKEICLIGEQYRATFGSFRRSPITATHCTLSAALVLLRGQSAKEGKETGPHLDLFKSCIKTLQELSESWTPPGRYWKSLLRMTEQRQEPVSGPKTAANELREHEQAQGKPRPSHAKHTLENTLDETHQSQEAVSLFAQEEMQQDEMTFDFNDPVWPGFAPNILTTLPEDYINFDSQDFWL